jgi:hypothetical protein
MPVGRSVGFAVALKVTAHLCQVSQGGDYREYWPETQLQLLSEAQEVKSLGGEVGPDSLERRTHSPNVAVVAKFERALKAGETRQQKATRG